MIRDTRLVLGFGIATLLLLGTGSIAHAQYQSPPPAYNAPPPGYGGYPPPPPPPQRTGMYRDGLVLGFGLGGGGITGNCAPGFCGGAISGEFHVGGMIQPRMALLFDLWGNARTVGGTQGDVTFSQTFWTAALQFWLIDQLWVKGGLGISHVQVSDDFYGTQTDETALGLMLGAGVEVLQIGNMALDLQFRFGHGFYDTQLNNYAFLVGLSWY